MLGCVVVAAFVSSIVRDLGVGLVGEWVLIVSAGLLALALGFRWDGCGEVLGNRTGMWVTEGPLHWLCWVPWYGGSAVMKGGMLKWRGLLESAGDGETDCAGVPSVGS